MSLTTEQARDLIAQLMKNAIDAWNVANPTKQVVETVWDDAETKSDENGKVIWCRVTIAHDESSQRSLGRIGRRKFTRTGIVTAQVFTPFGDGFTVADRLPMGAIRNALEDASLSNVWFRRVSARELGKSGLHQQTNVTAVFEYDERR